MTAPSLILLGSAGADPRVAGVSQELRAMLTTARPEVDVAVAFLDQGYPRCLQVAGKLAKRGVTEVVVVPLHVADAHPRQPETAALIAQIRTAHPSLRVIAAAPVGPEAQLLSVVDQRLRDALRARRVDQLDGLVLSTEATTDVRSNALLARRARQWSARHRLPCLVATGGSGPSVADAIRSLHAQGRRHIAVGSWFLTADEGFLQQAALARAARAVAVAAPLGASAEVAEIILSRYVVAAMELIDLEVLTEPEHQPARHLSVVGA